MEAEKKNIPEAEAAELLRARAAELLKKVAAYIDRYYLPEENSFEAKHLEKCCFSELPEDICLNEQTEYSRCKDRAESACSTDQEEVSRSAEQADKRISAAPGRPAPVRKSSERKEGLAAGHPAGIAPMIHADMAVPGAIPLPELDESFSEMLLRLIDRKELKNAEVYKGALISRAVFSNIVTKPKYHPKKETVFALAVSLKLNLPETKQLLERAGYALSHSFRFDVAMEYFIQNGKYDIFEINEVLLELDLPLLGEKAA